MLRGLQALTEQQVGQELRQALVGCQGLPHLRQSGALRPKQGRLGEAHLHMGPDKAQDLGFTKTASWSQKTRVQQLLQGTARS